jgi:hypothetical protein
MNQYPSKISFSNESPHPRVVWIEPWAEDFTLLPKESLAVHASSKNEIPWLGIIEWDDCQTQIYVEPLEVSYTIVQAGRQLTSGHNRVAAIRAGIAAKIFYGPGDE